jgi:DNA-binding NarL/FixJ family response regulator
MNGRGFVSGVVPRKHFDVLSAAPVRSSMQSVRLISSGSMTLDKMEREILQLPANGQSNAEIAVQLFLSDGIVRNYVSWIFGKLEVTDRTQAIVIALRHGLVDAVRLTKPRRKQDGCEPGDRVAHRFLRRR